MTEVNRKAMLSLHTSGIGIVEIRSDSLEKTMKTITKTISLGICAALMASGLVAQGYPDRPITMIVPWGAGGGTDATARIVAQLLEEELGEPINVVNRTGGGSVIGHTEIANATPDGYTLGAITTELSMFHWLEQSDITSEDYSPIGLFNADYGGIFVRTDSRFETLQEVVDAWRENANAIAGGGANQGGVNHLAYAAMVSEAGGNNAFWVPTEGAAPALQQLTAGTIDIAVVQFPEASALMEAGEIRPLATLGSERNSDYSDVPTVDEASDIEYSISGWRGLAGPKGLPDDVIDTLINALEKVVTSNDYKKFMDSRQFTIAWAPGEKFEKYLAEKDAQFGDGLRAAGLAD